MYVHESEVICGLQCQLFVKTGRFLMVAGSTHTVKSVVSKKWCNIDTLFLQTTNEVLYSLQHCTICDDVELPEGLSAVARLTNGIGQTFVQHFAQCQLMQRVARSLGDNWASTLHHATQGMVHLRKPWLRGIMLSSRLCLSVCPSQTGVLLSTVDVCLEMFGCLQAERTIATSKRNFLNKFSVIHIALCRVFVVIAKTELESCCTDV